MIRRNSILLLCFALTGFTYADANAGLCDWLFGRTNSPYVAGYAPYGSYGYGLNAPYAANSYAAGYPPVAVVGATAPQNGVYQAQMLSYDNPSVYTGRPVMVNQGLSQTAYSLPIAGTTAPLGVAAPNYGASYGSYYGGAGLFGRAPATVPLAGLYRGPNTSSNPFYGTGNIYPTTNPAGVYQANYPSTGIPGAPIVSSVPTGLPGSAIPAAQVAPLFPAAPEPRLGGLSRFFGSLLGTNYRSSYYSAPITYYRPVTSIDPISGTTVTMQQPCTSYVQQLQRTPYSSLQPGLIAPTEMPLGGQPCSGSGCQSTYPGYAASPLDAYPTTVSPYGLQPPSDVAQAGGYLSPNDRLVVPIPSTQQPGYYQQPDSGINTSPLTGTVPDDRAPVDQPRLESARPNTETDWWRQDSASEDDFDQSNDSNYDSETRPGSYLRQDNFGDRSAAIERQTNMPIQTNSPVQQVQAFSDARPIAAPKGFENPLQHRTVQPVTPVNRGDLVAPQLPPPTISPQYDRESYSASVRVSVPVREATQRQSAIRLGPAVPSRPQPKRDNVWYSSK